MSFKRILKIVAPVFLFITATGCATARGRVVTTNCVSDPLTRSLQCVDKLGNDLTIPWESSANFICRPPEDDQLLLNEAFKK